MINKKTTYYVAFFLLILNKAKKDSLDSIAKLDPKQLKATKSKRSARSSKVKSSKIKSSSSASSGARITVRRQRH